MPLDSAVQQHKKKQEKQTNKTKNDVDPAFLERSYVGLNAPLWREGLVCAEMECYPASISAVCCAVNVKPRGSDTHRPFNPPSLRPLPYLTLQFQAALAYLINRATRLGAPELQMRPIIMLLQMSKAGLLAHVCLFTGIVHGVGV